MQFKSLEEFLNYLEERTSEPTNESAPPVFDYNVAALNTVFRNAVNTKDLRTALSVIAYANEKNITLTKGSK